MVSRSGTTQSQQPLDLRMFESALRLFDDQINRSSYDANHWVRRGSFMREHGFPEIAVGDAFKAKLLLDREPANLEARKAVYEILGQALLGCHCHWEAAELWEEALKQYPRWGMAGEKATDLRELLRRKEAAAASLGGTPQEQKDRLKDGGVFTVNYRWTEFSWTPERSLTRSSKLVALINEELRGKDGETTCYLARSTLAADGNDDMLGMFASHEMQNGEYHPLIARLQPLSNKHHIDVFTLTESVAIPLKILEQLGVDIFANRNFDTGVLQPIWTRLANNKAAERDGKLGYVDDIYGV
ncbi:hypothetical protein PtrSN002B_010913 [Pyrenophora tritici-repentis]|nr:hypothetical protein PtrSN002B_010913 [Pyrenophora tritici-repentis]KAI1563798.1 hypothetical protein PtrEW4_009206 [Pyrenophora tritici-repentis]PZD29449.1 hypothetical protein A1F96_05101 [Pyrenophora tritici-repentis]